MFLGIKEEKGQTSNTLGKPFSLLKTVLESLMCSSSSWFCQEDKELVAFPIYSTIDLFFHSNSGT